MKIHLKAGKDKPVRAGHPWIFSGAVARVEGAAGSNNECVVYDDGGSPIGAGYYNEKSAIRVRMLSVIPRAGHAAGGKGARPPATPEGLAFTAADLRRRVARAIDRRAGGGILTGATDSCRLINSEGDFLPGLVVDRYGPGVCLQIGTAGMETWRADVVEALTEALSPEFIYERSDTESRRREGLGDSEGLVSGSVPESLVIVENGVRYGADLSLGQKTGFFFDQRDNRALVRRYSAGRSVCDCFCYSGGFAVSAALGGAASVCAVDVSAGAGARLAENARLNGVSVEFVKADVFAYLRSRQAGVGLIVLDPPKFARHPGEVERAARGYKDINLAALRLLSPDGLLFTFSCSGAVDPYLFRQIVFAAASDAGRQVQILHVLTAGPDHPVNIAHREGEYLKGLVLRAL